MFRLNHMLPVNLIVTVCLNTQVTNGYSHAFVSAFRRSFVIPPKMSDISLLSLSPPEQAVTLKTRLFSSYDDGSGSAMHDSARTLTDSTPDPLLLPASPRYATHGTIGLGNFTISRLGGPMRDELSNENILKIVLLHCTDLEVNTLVWKCLGYRFNVEKEFWNDAECFPKWREKYPSSDGGGFFDNPPDFIGMQRIYEADVDKPCLKANQALVRSLPEDMKQWLLPTMKPLGWNGYKYEGLTPNKTRRGQCANWLIYYREELFGYTISELKERRVMRQNAKLAEESKKDLNSDDNEKKDKWKPPVRQVF